MKTSILTFLQNFYKRVLGHFDPKVGSKVKQKYLCSEDIEFDHAKCLTIQNHSSNIMIHQILIEPGKNGMEIKRVKGFTENPAMKQTFFRAVFRQSAKVF